MDKNRRGQWPEFAGGPGGPTGSEAADLARRMRLVDPDDASGWESDDNWRSAVRLSR